MFSWNVVCLFFFSVPSWFGPLLNYEPKQLQNLFLGEWKGMLIAQANKGKERERERRIEIKKKRERDGLMFLFQGKSHPWHVLLLMVQ